MKDEVLLGRNDEMRSFQGEMMTRSHEGEMRSYEGEMTHSYHFILLSFMSPFL